MANRQHDQIQWVPTGDPATVDMKTNPYPGALGGAYTDPNGKRWRLVQGDSSMSVTPFKAAVMWWADKTNFKVTTDLTKLGRGQGAGICPAAKGSGNYFFIGIGGKHLTKFVDAPTAAPTIAGLFVIPSATAGKADCLAAGSAATYPPLGRSAGAYDAANTECLVDLEIPEDED